MPITASIFQRTGRKNEPYTIQYVDHLGKRRTRKGFTDRGLTGQLAAKLEGEARLQTTGLIDPDQEQYSQHKLAPIGGHLAAFEESLLDNSPLHVSVTMGRVKKIVEGCGFERLADFDKEAIRCFLRRLRKGNDFGHRTINHYMQAIDSFCRWCVANKRLLVNPLCGLERLNAEVDVRRKRRALTAAEVARMINAAWVSTFWTKLFPGLEKRRTARMVRRDLKDAGIPFETDEGIADFHAAGRHTHITELLRNGVTLPEAKELARHTSSP